MIASVEEEDFVKYGTSLEPIGKDEIPKKKPCLLEDQIVKDKQGRRRFHGAFTGGFSAGFYNTVGSLEGWVPSTFKSSRSEKQSISQKPEDFMDEEDIGEFGIAPTVLKTKTDYSTETKSSRKRSHQFKNLGSYVFQNILEPAKESVGMRLLIKMGWKPGQGIGPRITKQDKKNSSAIRARVYGCQNYSENLSDGESDSDINESLSDNITFAPSDYEPFLFNPKKNLFGIGYEGLPSKMSCSTSENEKINFTSKNINKNKFYMKGEAFGVGAFEDEDEDIYAKEDLSEYDFYLSNKTVEHNKTFQTIEKLDGILKGFIIQKMSYNKINYSLPILPKNFKSSFKNRKGKIIKEEKNLAFKDEIYSTVSKKPSDTAFSFDKQVKHPQFSTDNNKTASQSVEQPERTEIHEIQDSVTKLLHPYAKLFEKEFISARQKDDDLTVIANITDESNEELNDMKKAAKMKMYGRLTRKTEEWYPSSLLCKRFNVREPNNGSQAIKTHSTKKKEIILFDKFNVSTSENTNLNEKISLTKIDEKDNGFNDNKKINLQTEENQDSENKENIKEKESVNKIDLFKAIFLSDEENDEKIIENDYSSEKNNKIERVENKNYEEIIINKEAFSPVKTNLNENNKSKSPDINKFENKIAFSNPKAEDSSSDLMYGPKIPDKISSGFNRIENNFFDISQWVEKNKVDERKKSPHKSKHSHKSSHKHKSKHKLKHKSKHKKKKK